MTPGDKFAVMLVPNGTVEQVYQNPSIGGDKTPLYSIPTANPYPITSASMGAQVAALDDHGSVFSFEDIRLDSGGDRDYNDMTFQVTGARGVGPPVDQVRNPNRDLVRSAAFSPIGTYAAAQSTADVAATTGVFRSGVGTVGPGGTIWVDYLFDGGGFESQVAIFSLQGMNALEPGSADFIKEAARRSLSDSTLGHIVVSDTTEAARNTAVLPWEGDRNRGTYADSKAVAMTPGDKFDLMMVPAGTVWGAYTHPENLFDIKKRPVFSMPEANITNKAGNDQFAAYMADGTTVGFEDLSLATWMSDRDYNDVILRIAGATVSAPSLESVVPPSRNTFKAAMASQVLA